MNILLNKNLIHLKKAVLTALVLVGLVLAPIISSGQAFADPPATPAPAPAPAPASSLAGDAKCTGGANACVDNQSTDIQACPTADDCNLVKKYLNPFIKLLSALAIIAVVIGVTYGGIEYSSSGGDSQKVAKAKNHIRNSIIGLIAFFFLYAFLKFLIPGGDLTG